MTLPARPSATSPVDHRAELSLDWLIRLRWGAAAFQAAMVTVGRIVLGTEVPYAQLLVFVALLASSNAVLVAIRRRSPFPRALCGAALTLDILLLSGLLHGTGGPHNPFSVLYLVYITLAAVVLGARWTWFLAGLSVGCYGLLFAWHIPLQHLNHLGPQMSLHLEGMWLAFTLAAILTASFVARLSSAIERRDAAMAEMRERAGRHERLAAVTTLAAGAAHELGTPLATIAVVAKELERSIQRLPAEQATGLREDAGLIRAELDRCRAILDRLAAGSGQLPGEAPQTLTVEEVGAAIVEGLSSDQRKRLDVRAESDGYAVRLPRAPLLQVAQNLLRNAFEASDGAVALAVEAGKPGLSMTVHDAGPGMPPDVLARVGEPFFSTKAPGQGLGLGVFIARTLSEQMGGRLRIESRPGHGTRAQVEIGDCARPTAESHGG